MFEILGYIFVTLILFYLLVEVILIGINFFKDSDAYDKYRHITCKTSFYTWNPRVESLYVLPGVSIQISSVVSISIEWLYCQYFIELSVQTDEEDEASQQAINEIRNESKRL